MAERVADLDEVLVVVGSSAEAIAERILVAIRDVPGLSASRPSPDLLHLAQVTRRFGTRRTRQLSVRLISEPQRVVVALRGQIVADLAEPLRAAAEGRSMQPGRRPQPPAPPVAPPLPTTWPQVEPVPVPPSTGPPPPAPAGTAWSTVAAPDSVPIAAPTDWFVTPSPGPSDEMHTVARRAAPHRASVVRLVAAGASPVDVGELTLVGRDPTPRPGEQAARLVSIGDPSVSKTHLAIGTSGEQVWAEDRGSTNGSFLIDERGRAVALEPGLRATLVPPARLLVGDAELRVERS